MRQVGGDKGLKVLARDFEFNLFEGGLTSNRCDTDGCLDSLRFRFFMPLSAQKEFRERQSDKQEIDLLR